MASVKANNYLQLLDTARCNGEGSEVPELARKVQKHAPGRRCLCIIAVTERHIHHQTLAQPSTTSPEAQKFFSGLLAPLVDELSKHHLPLPNLPSPAGGGQRADVTPEDIFQAKVTVAWIHFLIGDYKTVLEKLPSEEETPKLTGAEHPGNEYTRVSVLKSIVLRGLAFEFACEKDQFKALQIYKMATYIPQPSIGLYTEWRVWNEKALGRFALVAYKCWVNGEERASRRLRRLSGIPTDEETDGKEDDEQGETAGGIIDSDVLFAFRSYHKHINAIMGYPSTPAKNRERGEVYRHYVKFLSTLLSPKYSYRFDNLQTLVSKASHRSLNSSFNTAIKGGNTIGVVGGGLVGGIGMTREEFKDEIRSIQEVYENYLRESVSFPQADEVHMEVLEWVDLVVTNWKNMGATGEDAKAVIEILYRACGKTFQSPRILRYLFTTLTAVGDFHDAILALNTYVELISRAKARISRGGEEKDLDTDTTILETTAEGVRVLAKYENNGKRAMEIAELTKKWIEEWKVVSSIDLEREANKNRKSLDLALVNPMDQYKKVEQSIVAPEVLATAWRGIAIANSCWARQTVEAAKRPEIQQAAEEAFRRALSYDPEDVESYFGLGMVLAETRHIEDGIEVVKNGLMVLNCLKNAGEEHSEGYEEEQAVQREYRREVVPFWHLLALLLSASEEFDAALRVSDAVFEEFGGESELLKRGLGSNTAFERGDTIREMITRMGQDEKENLMEVKMTQIALIEMIDGPEYGINMADELFALYASLFDATAVQEHIQKVQDERLRQHEALTVDDDKTIKGRPMSRYSRFGRSQTKIASAVGAPRPTTSGSTTVGRPKSSHTTAAPRIQVTEANGTEKAPSTASISTTPTTAQEADGGKLKKRASRAASVSAAIVGRRKSLGSMKSSVSGHGTVRGSSSRLRRSPSMGSTSTVVQSAKEASPPPPLPMSSLPTSPISATCVIRPHIFHLHKHVNPSPPATSALSADAPGLPDSIEENEKLGGRPPTTSNSLQPPASNFLSSESKRTYLLKKLPEPSLSQDQENRKVVEMLRRIWLLAAGLYRRGGMFDEAQRALEEAANLKTGDGDWEADVLAERGYLAMSQQQRPTAAINFENALAYDLDHPRAIIGLCQVILSIPTDFSPGSDLSYKESNYQFASPQNIPSTTNTSYNTESGPQRPIAPSSSLSPKSSHQNLQACLNPSTAASSALVGTPRNTATPPTVLAWTPKAKDIAPHADGTFSDDESSSQKPALPPRNKISARGGTENIQSPSIDVLTARNRAYGLLTGLTKSGRGWDCSEAWFELARTYEEGGQIERAKEVLWWCVGLEDTRPVRQWGGEPSGVGGGKRIL